MIFRPENGHLHSEKNTVPSNPILPKGSIKLLLRLRKPLRPRRLHVEMILQPDAVLAGHDDHRFVGEAHARRQRRLVALHQIGAFVDVETDAVAGAVGEAWQLVVGAESVADQHIAGGLIDRFAGGADGGAVEGRLLGFLFHVPQFFDLAIQFGKRVGAGDVGIIAVDGAAGVDQDQFALPQRRVAGYAVWMRGRFAELDGAKAVAAIGATGAVQAVDFGDHFAGFHARHDPLENRLVDREGELHGRDHQVDFLL